MSISFKSRFAAAAAGAAMLTAAPAMAVTSISFVNIFPASSTELAVDPYVSAFSATISNLGANDAGVNMLRFGFASQLASPSGSFIGGTFIDDSALGLLSAPAVNFNNVGTVNFGSAQGAFPQGNKIGFNEDAAFRFEGGAANGVQFNEELGIMFSYAGLFDDLVEAVNYGDIRFGLHIQGLPGGASDSIVSAVIPLPTGALLLISAFGVAVAGRKVLRRDA